MLEKFSKFNPHLVASAVVLAGLAFGVVFGAGYAVGQGSPKEVQTGLTTTQLATLLGVDTIMDQIETALGQGGPAARGGGFGGGGGAGGPGGGGFLSNLGTLGKVIETAEGEITIQTRQGEISVRLGPETSITTLADASAELLGDVTVIVSGDVNDDGSIDATAITQLPAEFSGLFP